LDRRISTGHLHHHESCLLVRGVRHKHPLC
jgi:hypothetical protein